MSEEPQIVPDNGPAHFELFGQELRPYSASRRVAANAMGVLFPMLGEEGFAQLQRTSTYPGMLKDTIAFLWLCTLKDAHELTKEDVQADVWTPTRATMKPAQAFEAALAWADGVGIVDMTSERFSEACQTFLAIANGVEAAKFRVVVSGQQPEPEDDLGKV